MKLVGAQGRRYPCQHGFAQFGDGEPAGAIPRRCPTCKTRYLVTFEPATEHTQEITGATVWRARWAEA